MDHDITSFARSVMVSDVQRLFVDPSFPPELRLQVMKAGVPSNTTCNLSVFSSMKTIVDLRNEAHDLLLSPARELWYQVDPWADEETANIFKSVAEQAFLETAMFKLVIDRSLPALEDEGWLSGVTSLSETIGPRIHYLHMNTTTQGSYYWQRPVNVTWCRKLITGMEMLKVHFPNLKACILTLDICFASAHAHPDEAFNQRVLQWTAGTDTEYSISGTSLVAEVTALFNVFITKGPGKSQFVPIRYFTSGSHDHYSEDPIYYSPLVKVDCGKMAAESEKGSLGTQLLEKAYCLERIFERS
jgi:hypothetical protein